MMKVKELNKLINWIYCNFRFAYLFDYDGTKFCYPQAVEESCARLLEQLKNKYDWCEQMEKDEVD